MNENQLKSYFERIDLEVPARADLDTLRRIQEHHIHSVPVENLDILDQRLPLSLEIEELYDKIVVRRRGGLSFELNTLLADALNAVGYDAQLMAAKHPRYGNEFDHVFLLVRVPGEEGAWLVDVGFTECPRTILLFDERVWQSDTRDDYLVRKDPDDASRWQLVRRRGQHEAVDYSFDLQPHAPEEYAEQCAWFCTNENSRFTQGPFVFIERPEGRICLSMDAVTNTITGEAVRPLIRTGEEYEAVLREIFGIEAVGGEALGGKQYEGADCRRVFAAIDDGDLQEAVIEEAVKLAIEQHAHLRFGYVVNESQRADKEIDFPSYVQKVRREMNASVRAQIEKLGAADRLFGGELVVMGSNSNGATTIDAPANFVPEQLAESIIKPFGPNVVVCGTRKHSKFESFFKSHTDDYLQKKLDCEIRLVS